MVACSSGGGDDDEDEGPAIPVEKSGTLIALTNDNRLLSFDPGAPGELLSNRPINDLAAGEIVLAIDYRPATGELLGFTSAGRLYRIEASSGDATPIGAGPIAPPLSGTDFGFDVNPSADRIRVTSEQDENVRIDPNTGALLATDTPLAYEAGDPNFGSNPSVTAIAYTNAFAGATATTLYGIDTEMNALVEIGAPNGGPGDPNGGELTTIGQLGVDATFATGLDVSPSGAIFLVATIPGATSSRLYSIDPETGGADNLGAVGGTLTIRDVTVRPPAPPRIFALTASGRLVSFRPGLPTELLDNDLVTGLQTGETLLAIDIRPSTGELYGLGSSSRLYRVDKDDAELTAVGAGSFTPVLQGTDFSLDFDPATDLARVVSDGDQHLLIDPGTGAVAAVGATLAFAAGDPNFGDDPALVGLAHTDNVSGTASTTVFAIDRDQDSLVRIGSVGGTPSAPALSQISTVGALLVDVVGAVGLDTSAYGALWATITGLGAANSQLYTIHPTTGAATLFGTIGVSGVIADIAYDVPVLPLVFGVTTNNRLISFRPGDPTAQLSIRQFTGLQNGETVLAIDFRPSTGDLYALGSSSRLYLVSRSSGSLGQVGPGAFSPALSGTEFGMDFNPVFDPLRIVSETGQNLRINAITGAAVLDSPLMYVAGDPNAGTLPRVVALAHDKSFTGTQDSTLYGIDSNLDTLVRVGDVTGLPNSPNTGQTHTLGDLGVDTSDLAGFDISTYGGAFLLVNPPTATQSQLHVVNLATGATRPLGTITAAGSNNRVRGLAFLPLGL